MNKIAVIGSSQFGSLKNLVITHSTTVQTPYGEPSSVLSYGILGEREVVFLLRRENTSSIAPHKINYRANIWALRDAGVQTVLATAAVGGICPRYQPGQVVIPNQLIDYTYGRENTFFGEADISQVCFQEPYSENLRQIIIQKAESLDLMIAKEGTYAVTQGPRLETKAEATKLGRDGCHIVGMTGMPEAALARELGLEYACIALVRHHAAEPTKVEETYLEQQEQHIEKLVESIILHTA